MRFNGRRPREFDPRIPHFSALRYKFGLAQTQAPPSIDWTGVLPDLLGMMLNDSLGDCAEAGFFHSLQLWSANANPPMFSAPDSTVQQLYCDGAGYVPGNPATDQGTILQVLLKFLMNTGALMPDGSRHKILGFFEIDPKNDNDVSLVTAECGAVYFGWNVPQYIMALGPGTVWHLEPHMDNTIIGGHCTISGKYAAPASDGSGQHRGVISWGSKGYTMTEPFWKMRVDEAYGIIDPAFIEATGKTPFGQSLSVWETQMQAIKESP